MATNKWIPIVVGIVIFVVLVGAGLVGGFAYFVAKRVSVQQLSETGGQQEFDKLAAGMEGQKAFIEMPADRDGEVVVHRELETKDPGSLSTLHLRVWSSRERQLVSLDLPFWVVRLSGNKSLHINAGSSRAYTLRVTPEEIERRGPGLVLNHTTPDGDRVLIWTE